VNASNSTRAMTSVIYGQPSSPDQEWLARLPRRSRLELGAYETAPRTARGHITRVLEEWSLPEFCFYHAAEPGGKVTWAAITEP
jgi:hypothetical protein